MGLKSKRPRFLNYSVSKKGKKSGKKLEKAIKTYQRLLRRVSIEGETLWIKNALNFASARLKKYGIKPNTIKS